MIAIRKHRTSMVGNYLAAELDFSLDAKQWQSMEVVIDDLNSKDATVYLAGQKFLVHGFFWLVGPLAYLETMWWTVIGVLTSLIFYVSVANIKSLKTGGDDDSGAFDTSEISGQVAKMFYAPVTTLVIVLSYTYATSGTTGMVDVDSGKGLILFAFISGFFSGRLMQFLDNLKNLVLPVSANNGEKKPPQAAKSVDATVTLDWDNTVMQNPDWTAISAAGFAAAVVTLGPDGGGTPISPTIKATGSGNSFTFSNVTIGKYTVIATVKYKKDANSVEQVFQDQKTEVTINESSPIVALKLK